MPMLPSERNCRREGSTSGKTVLFVVLLGGLIALIPLGLLGLLMAAGFLFWSFEGASAPPMPVAAPAQVGPAGQQDADVPADFEKEMSKDRRARAQLAALSLAVASFKALHGDYPPSLDELAEPKDGKEPLVKKGDLSDPWGRPYQYDPAGPKNGGKPDLWSDGAAPGDPGSVIGNWMFVK
jgi:Type II secretion system (T2SS), protein G